MAVGIGELLLDRGIDAQVGAQLSTAIPSPARRSLCFSRLLLNLLASAASDVGLKWMSNNGTPFLHAFDATASVRFAVTF